MGLFTRAGRQPRAHVLTATDGRDVLLNDPDGWEIDAPWMWWLGPAGSDGTGGPFGNPIPGATSPGELAIGGLPAARRSTSIIVDTLAGLPWHVFRGYDRLPTPDWVLDPQGLRLDGRVVDASSAASVRLSAVEFWANWVTAALWFGDGYVYAPVRDAQGAPKPPLWQFRPDEVTIDQGAYWVADTPIPASSMIHLRGQPPYVGGHGVGVIDSAGSDLALASTIRQYASGIFSSGVPAGYLKSSSPSMTQDDADALKARWMAQHGSKRSIAVLNATTDFHAVSISPVDAQLTAAREWSTRDIALAFGVPAYMLGVPGDSSTYANVESRHRELQQFTLLPWSRRIESTLDAQLPRGTSLKVRSDGLLRGDTATRTAYYTAGLAGGWLTIDEVRELEDRPPLETGGGVL